MRELGQCFSGHLSINGRIYEIYLTAPWTDNEKLFINQEEVPQFPKAEPFQTIRAIYIENSLVRLEKNQDEITMNIVPDSETTTFSTSTNEIPCFSGISQLECETTYQKEEPSNFLRLQNRLLRTGFAFLLVGAFLFGMIYGVESLRLVLYLGMFIIAIIKFFYEVVRLYLNHPGRKK